MHVSKIFFSEGIQDFFLVDEEREDQNPLKAGHHQPASETHRTNIAKKSYIFVIFHGGGGSGPPVPPPPLIDQ